MAATFLQVYNDPPAGSPVTGNDGSSGTAPMNPTTYPVETTLPRHIVEGPSLCHHLRSFAQNYLTQISHLPLDNLSAPRDVIQHALTVPGIGDEGTNSAFFADTAGYAVRFVVSADQTPLNLFQFRTCDMVEGIRPDMVFTRNNHPRMVVEYKGVSAFDHHRGEISDLARANNGRGTELIYSPPEINGRSIVMKLGKYMIQKNCPFGLIFGGDKFFLVYRDSFVQQDRTYYQLVISPCLGSYNSPPMHNVVQLVIAVLLDQTPDAAMQNYSPPLTTIRTPYHKSNSSANNQKHSAPAKQHAKEGVTELRSGRQLPKKHAEDIGRIQYCTVSWPLSVFPSRKVILENIDASASRNNKETSSSLQLKETLGSGMYGTVHEGRWNVGTQELSCAVKTMSDPLAFKREVDVYRDFHTSSFTLPLYAAYHGIHNSQEFGVLITDKLERTFESYNDMTDFEKTKAIQRLRQLHAAGYRHGDISPGNFGINDGDIVLIDFSNTLPCGSKDHGACTEIRLLEEKLFEVRTE